MADLLDRVRAARDQSPGRAWPVGEGSLALVDRTRGHDDSRFSPEDYGDFLATSNDIYSVVNLRARRMGSLMGHLYNGNDAERVEVTDHAANVLLHKVNPFWTFARLLRMDELSMGVWGETYWVVNRDRSGRPGEIYWAKPSRMAPVPDPDDYLAGYAYTPANGGQPIHFGVDEVIWFRYPNPIDQFSALSPMAAARLAAESGKAMTEANRNLFRNGMQIGGIVAPKDDNVTWTREQAEKLEDDLTRRHRGQDKAHRWAVLRFDARFEQAAVSPKDAEFLGGLNMSLRQVCRAYGVPSPLMMDLEHATLANVQEFDRMLWEHTLVPEADFKAREIEEQFLPLFGAGAPDHFAWDYSQITVLQESHTQVWDRERGQLEVGALTINEWRKSKGLPPVAWGDVYWAPVNKAPIDDDGDTSAEPEPPRPAATPLERSLMGLRDELIPTNGHSDRRLVTVGPTA